MQLSGASTYNKRSSYYWANFLNFYDCNILMLLSSYWLETYRVYNAIYIIYNNKALKDWQMDYQERGNKKCCYVKQT